ncbi:hypothetical protein, partial [Lactiplantibacillus pentosus]|uniref:hypothetical protein n=1 Tax=Lactiplantibacillus pentosus TaxID=1589 RepID=UPI0021825041
QLLKDGFVVNTILKEADLFCPNSVRINFTIYQITSLIQPGPRNLIIAAKKAKEQESTEASHICFKNRFKASYKLPYKGYVG